MDFAFLDFVWSTKDGPLTSNPFGIVVDDVKFDADMAMAVASLCRFLDVSLVMALPFDAVVSFVLEG